jgi:excisionase family DNA binding protein
MALNTDPPIHHTERASASSRTASTASSQDFVNRDSRGTPAVSLDQPLLTVDGVAELLAMSPSSVYYLKDNGGPPYVLLGKRIRFSKQDIELYLAGCRRGPKAA